jgi:hypothetical protein
MYNSYSVCVDDVLEVVPSRLSELEIESDAVYVFTNNSPAVASTKV